MSDGTHSAECADTSRDVKRLVIKIGTSTLASDDGPPDTSYLESFAEQIASQKAMGRSVIIVSSGAIRSGMSALKLKGKPRTIPEKQAAAAIGQGVLMQTYADVFTKYGITVAQILLTRDDMRDRTRYLNARNTFAALLKFGVVPVVNENDTVAVDEIKFGDNDNLAALVASLADADTLLLLSDVDGLYDKDPTVHPDARLIPVVTKIDKSVEQKAGGARTTMGTGGMTTKIRAAKVCTNSGIRMIIADGRRGNVVNDALDGKCGTLFLPKTTRLRQRKQWIAFGAAPKGAVTVNDGAKQSLLNEGKSLLPAGIIHVSGHFHRGELVRIIDTGGTPFAKGFVNYNSDELAVIKGHRTTEIADILGDKHSDEVVHRDNLVIDL